MPASTPSDLRRHIPNALTVARVLLASLLFVVLSFWWYRQSPLAQGIRPDYMLLVAAGLFVLAAATDALDGYLARRWNVVSLFGRVMDPFADKVLVIGTFIFLAGPGFWVPISPADDASEKAALAAGLELTHVPGYQLTGVLPWMVAVILARELLVTSIRAVLESRGISFAATFSGKFKMILQSLCIPIILVLVATTDVSRGSVDLWPPGTRWFVDAIVLLTVVVTAWSGLPYILRALKAAKASRPLEKPQ